MDDEMNGNTGAMQQTQNKNTPIRRQGRGMRNLVIAGVAILMIGLVALNIWSRTKGNQAGSADTQQIALGRQVYAARCASCHGANLEGQPNWQQDLPTGGRPAPPHDETGHTWHHSDDSLFTTVKFGGQATSPPGYKSNMPPFGDVLSDNEIEAVLAYIKSTWPAEIQAQQQNAGHQ
jgi:mono/diheme cytochrome c family protein